MIRHIAPQFFTTELAATLAYYKDKLGFDCLGAWGAVGLRHRRARRAMNPFPPRGSADANADKYADEFEELAARRSVREARGEARLRRTGLKVHVALNAGLRDGCEIVGQSIIGDLCTSWLGSTFRTLFHSRASR